MVDIMVPAETVAFRCNICEAENVVPVSGLRREMRSCDTCGSTVRVRSIVHALTSELFGRSLSLREVPHVAGMRGVGMTCWNGYAQPLAERIGFRNTFYHREPRLDILAIDPADEGSLDFIVSSDVFEHVTPPVGRAFENARRLLKPGGVLILTVPYDQPDVADAPTIEHYPSLHDFEVVEVNGRKIVRNTTADGEVEEFRDPVFHGGAGQTLEMRVFSEASLIRAFVDAGFDDIGVYRRDYLPAGVKWLAPVSCPIAARVRGDGQLRVERR